MVKFLIISLLVLSSICIPAFAQVQSQQIGGPIVPKGNSTQQQYCWNGTCQTPLVGNATVSKNDTNRELFTKYPIIMIIPSELCTKALYYNVKTGCPSLQDIVKYDTSNQHISGFFYSINGKTLERSNPQVKNHWMYYGYSNHTIVCVYCTGNYLTTDLYKTIIIQPDTFEYVPKTFETVNEDYAIFNNSNGNFTTIKIPTNEMNTGLTSYLNREVRGCNTATIAYSDELLGDTIKYLESGCKITSYNKTKTQVVPNTPWVYDNPFSSLHYKAVVQQVKNNHPGLCFDNQCGLTTSTRKAGY